MAINNKSGIANIAIIATIGLAMVGWFFTGQYRQDDRTNAIQNAQIDIDHDQDEKISALGSKIDSIDSKVNLLIGYFGIPQPKSTSTTTSIKK